MDISNYLIWLVKAIKHGVTGQGNECMFEILLEEYLRVIYR
ncbi:hypothetical protein LCGC14_1261130 [marine sediment metagenome]|uniref:Uncharacterized protein n=1 Tax=marine sediment metagenome TaxID=412755 RepID=A0A0F9NHC5_9ZZZZ